MCRTTEILEDFETGRQTCTFRKIGRNKKKGRKTERLKYRQADIHMQGDKTMGEISRQKDRETKRKKDRETKRNKDRETKIQFNIQK